MKRSILSAEQLKDWAADKGIILNGINISTSPVGHGTGLVATAITTDPGSIFVEVPSDLLLNCSLVWKLSKSDSDLAAILSANKDLVKTTRGAILIFLLMQITHSSPDILESGYDKLPIGKPNVFSEYIQYIQTEVSLPLFWSEEEVSQLWATSLECHHASKMQFLKQEFEQLKLNCRGLPWSNIWFGEKGCLTFEDWLTVDAMWRSRAMDLSSSENVAADKGSCLVPIMDMANHTTEGIAAYKLFTTADGSPCARLVLDKASVLASGGEEGNTRCYEDAKLVDEGDEVTISYGSTKGAAEMIFSYGFLDEELLDARSIMLGWTLPEDDPLRFEKMSALKLERGIQIYTPVMGSKTVRFVSTAVWAMSINEEDGLKIVVDQENNEPETESTSIDKETRYKMFFKDTLIKSKSHLIDVLTHDRAALVFRTRAYAYVYIRIEEELSRREATIEEHSEEIYSESGHEPQSARARMCTRLRELEYVLLHRALNYFASELTRLTQEPDVINYPILLEQGLSLPELSETERWNRYELDHDEGNRTEYACVLENAWSTLTDADLGSTKPECKTTRQIHDGITRESENWTGWHYDWQDIERDDVACGTDKFEIVVMDDDIDDELILAQERNMREEWSYGKKRLVHCNIEDCHDNEELDVDEEEEVWYYDEKRLIQWSLKPEEDETDPGKEHPRQACSIIGEDMPILESDEMDHSKEMLADEPRTPNNEWVEAYEQTGGQKVTGQAMDGYFGDMTLGSF